MQRRKWRGIQSSKPKPLSPQMSPSADLPGAPHVVRTPLPLILWKCLGTSKTAGEQGRGKSKQRRTILLQARKNFSPWVRLDATTPRPRQDLLCGCKRGPWYRQGKEALERPGPVAFGQVLTSGICGRAGR